MPTTYRGVLERFSGSWGSGLAFLIIDGRPIPCENAPTVRALEACFGNVIQPNHIVSSRSFMGREVIFSVDDLSVLLGFTPVENWTGPEIPDEGMQDR